MFSIKEDEFISDYNALVAEKEQVAVYAKEQVATLNTSDELKEQFVNMMVEETCKAIQTKIDFYEKYLVEKADDTSSVETDSIF